MEVKEEIKLDLLADTSPALSARSDVPIVETKPDSQPAPKEEKPEAKVDAAPDEGKKVEESAPSEKPDEDAAANTEVEGKPKAKGVQKRIDELVKQREEEKAEKLRLLALVEQYQKPAPKVEERVEDDQPQRPSRDAFADTAAYEAALGDYADAKAAWSAKQAVSEALAAEAQKTEQRQIEEGQKQAREAYQARVTKTSEKYADYKEVAESPNVTVTIAMAQAIMHSQHGPEIQYFLGKNPEEAKRISTLNPAEQLVELGLVVGKLSAPAPDPKPKPIVSSAPKPIKTLEAKSETVEKDPSEMSMEEYAVYARKRDADAKRRGAFS